MSYNEELQEARIIGKIIYRLRNFNIIDKPTIQITDEYLSAMGYSKEQADRLAEEISNGLLNEMNITHLNKTRSCKKVNEFKLSCQTCDFHIFRNEEDRNNFVWWNNLCTYNGYEYKINYDSGTHEAEYPFCRSNNPDGLCEWHSRRCIATEDDILKIEK